MQFTPLVDFEDKELRSIYLKGLTYTVRARKPNPMDPEDMGTPMAETKLFGKVQEWLREGRVVLGASQSNPNTSADDARLRGEGKVE